MKTWFITGVSRGLGQALAQAALDRGDNVIGTVRSGAPALKAQNGALHVLTLDMTDGPGTTAAVERAFGLVPAIDVVVNNAGHGLLGAFEDADDDEIEGLFEADVFGPMRLVRAALPRLRAQGRGHVINVTSIAGRAPMASSVVYAAAKFALEGFSASLAQELAPTGVKVTAVAPGAFRTDFLTDHSLRRSTRQAEGYEESAGKALAALDGMNGKQAGDPVRAAQAILALADAPQPPAHLLLGTDALNRFRAKLDAMQAEIAAWEAITRSTDFPKAG